MSKKVKNQVQQTVVVSDVTIKKTYKNHCAALKAQHYPLFENLDNWVKGATSNEDTLKRKERVISAIQFPLVQEQVSQGLLSLGLPDYQLIDKESIMNTTVPISDNRENIDEHDKISECIGFAVLDGTITEEYGVTLCQTITSLQEVEKLLTTLQKKKAIRNTQSEAYKKALNDPQKWYKIPGRNIVISSTVKLKRVGKISLVGTVDILKETDTRSHRVSVKVDETETENGKPSLASENQEGTYVITKAFHLVVAGKDKQDHPVKLDRFVITGLEPVVTGEFQKLKNVRVLQTPKSSVLPKKDIVSLKKVEDAIHIIATLLSLEDEDEISRKVTSDLIDQMMITRQDIERVVVYYQSQLHNNPDTIVQQIVQTITELTHKIEQLTQELDLCYVENGRLEMELSALELRLQALYTKKTVLAERHIQIGDALDKLEHTYMNEKKGLEQQLKTNQSKIQSLQTVIETHKITITEKSQEFENLETTRSQYIIQQEHYTLFINEVKQVIVYQEEKIAMQDATHQIDVESIYQKLGI